MSKEKIKKVVATLFIILLIGCPILYIFNIVIQESYYKEIVCTDIVSISEVRPADGATPYSLEWEDNQSLLLTTNDPSHRSLKANEPEWDKAYSGTALIEITWKDGWYQVLSLDMGACNGS